MLRADPRAARELRPARPGDLEPADGHDLHPHAPRGRSRRFVEHPQVAVAWGHAPARISDEQPDAAAVELDAHPLRAHVEGLHDRIQPERVVAEARPGARERFVQVLTLQASPGLEGQTISGVGVKLDLEVARLEPRPLTFAVPEPRVVLREVEANRADPRPGLGVHRGHHALGEGVGLGPGHTLGQRSMQRESDDEEPERRDEEQPQHPLAEATQHVSRPRPG